ncbi:General transcription factor IIH subunit 4, partial [Geodia barretti]
LHGGSGLTITTRGFQFLLLERSTQVWFFIINYLQVVTAERGFNLLECLSYLFQLSFSTLGKDYSREGMTECQEGLLQHLRMFGLVYQRKVEEEEEENEDGRGEWGEKENTEVKL